MYKLSMQDLKNMEDNIERDIRDLQKSAEVQTLFLKTVKKEIRKLVQKHPDIYKADGTLKQESITIQGIA